MAKRYVVVADDGDVFGTDSPERAQLALGEDFTVVDTQLGKVAYPLTELDEADDIDELPMLAGEADDADEESDE